MLVFFFKEAYCDGTHVPRHTPVLDVECNDDGACMVIILAVSARGWRATFIASHNVSSEIQIFHLSSSIEDRVRAFKRSVGMVRSIIVLNRMRVGLNVAREHLPIFAVFGEKVIREHAASTILCLSCVVCMVDDVPVVSRIDPPAMHCTV